MCREFIKPQGDRFFQQVSRYDNYLVEVAKRPGYKSGDTLKLILPFLKAHGLTNAQIEAYSRKNVTLMPGAEGTFKFLHSRDFPIFEISTGYRPFAEAVGLKLGFQKERIFCTELDLDRYSLSGAEAEELKRLQGEIAGAPEIELPPDAAAAADLPAPVQEAIAVLDRIFGERLPAMEIGALLQEVNPIGGPEKAKAVTDSLAQTKLSMADIIYVGDSLTDVQAFETVRDGKRPGHLVQRQPPGGERRGSDRGGRQRLAPGDVGLHLSVVGQGGGAGGGIPGDPGKVQGPGAAGSGHRAHCHGPGGPPV